VTRIPSTEQLGGKLQTVATLARAGIIRPQRPDRLLRAGLALVRWGATPAAGYKAAASRYPDAIGLIDERGELTFRELHERSNAFAHALARDGVRAGDAVAIMCRNHRGWVDGYVAANKLGAHALFLNTAFSGPQLADVAQREDPAAIVFDEEFADALAAAAEGRRRYLAWHEPGGGSRDVTIDELVERGDRSDHAPPPEQGKAVILTSGTTGAPKGARRRQPQSLDPVAALLEQIPLRARDRTMIAAPLFHSWGFTHFTLALGLATTIVLQRRFDPEATLAEVARHSCTALVVVPVMIQRILALDDERLRRHDVSSLRAVPVSGSALPGAMSERWMDLFGDNLYNLYGSTETAWATIATPADLRAAPGTAGRPPRGTIVRLFDADGRDVAPGESGRIFVGNDLAFEGYSGGGGKVAIQGLLSSGDVGHFDAAGRLFVDGRDDDMIVSGGENVFPAEVEELLAAHDAVAEAAVFGVDDEQFGQRLKAVVVTRPGKTLSADDVRRFVKSNLAAYKVPRDVEFVAELPRTSTGKVLKRELRGDSGQG
jgi:acyl-CoA synthetase (AMP-forming)/AMP-acid ligase II